MFVENVQSRELRGVFLFVFGNDPARDSTHPCILPPHSFPSLMFAKNGNLPLLAPSSFVFHFLNISQYAERSAMCEESRHSCRQQAEYQWFRIL